jgi:hypothetical protein
VRGDVDGVHPVAGGRDLLGVGEQRHDEAVVVPAGGRSRPDRHTLLEASTNPRTASCVGGIYCVRRSTLPVARLGAAGRVRLRVVRPDEPQRNVRQRYAGDRHRLRPGNRITSATRRTASRRPEAGHRSAPPGLRQPTLPLPGGSDRTRTAPAGRRASTVATRSRAASEVDRIGS